MTDAVEPPADPGAEAAAPVVVFIHTIPLLVEFFDDLAAKLLPGVRSLHVVDEPALELVRRHGGLDAAATGQVAAHAHMAEAVGARAVLVTCSTLSPCVGEVGRRVAVPVVGIDEPMLAAAVGEGGRIGVIATARTTLQPTRDSLEEAAARHGREITVESVFVAEALPALLGGDGETHDRLVRAAALDLARRSDVVVLAQATMARALDTIPVEERPVPILSSPHSALAHLDRLIATAEPEPGV